MDRDTHTQREDKEKMTINKPSGAIWNKSFSHGSQKEPIAAKTLISDNQPPEV